MEQRPLDDGSGLTDPVGRRQIHRQGRAEQSVELRPRQRAS